ncbi:MAG: DUF2934 domain-containing protein [Verrucomicrobiota bacterium]
MNQTSSTTNSSASTDLSADAISNRAYELWENEGRPEGSDQRHWFQAEQELRNSVSRNGSQSAPTPSRNSDVAPLKGTRAGAAVESAAARSSAPTPTSSSSSQASRSNGGKRASASPFPGNSQNRKATPTL